jgi:hypothetical protein
MSENGEHSNTDSITESNSDSNSSHGSGEAELRGFDSPDGKRRHTRVYTRHLGQERHPYVPTVSETHAEPDSGLPVAQGGQHGLSDKNSRQANRRVRRSRKRKDIYRIKIDGKTEWCSSFNINRDFLTLRSSTRELLIALSSVKRVEIDPPAAAATVNLASLESEISTPVASGPKISGGLATLKLRGDWNDRQNGALEAAMKLPDTVQWE